MRKIYINKRLVERVKTLRDLLSDVGSVHEFPLGDIPLGESLPAEGRRVAQLHIVPKGFSGFTYQVRRAPIGAPLLARPYWRATVGAPQLARHCWRATVGAPPFKLRAGWRRTRPVRPPGAVCLPPCLPGRGVRALPTFPLVTHLGTPRHTSAHLGPPHLTSPHRTSPHLASPDVD